MHLKIKPRAFFLLGKQHANVKDKILNEGTVNIYIIRGYPIQKSAHDAGGYALNKRMRELFCLSIKVMTPSMVHFVHPNFS